MKSIAVSTLRQQFPDYDRCGAEISFDTTATGTLPNTRRADAVVEFTDQNIYYGNGLIIEIQYRNHGKDLFATTHDYLSLGYSVYWATSADFDNDRLDFDSVESKFSQQEDDAYAVYNYDSDDFSTELAASLEWEDPVPSCDHDWQEMTDATPRYESCPRCETNRIYDNDRTRYLYDTAAMLGPIADPPASEESSCLRNDGHLWEPYEMGVDRCAACSVRRIEITDEWGLTEPRTIILDMTYMGEDLTELTSNPKTCDHRWEESRGGQYQCNRCGLIDPMLY